jgi:DNA-binding YbaB/EbfC family protein
MFNPLKMQEMMQQAGKMKDEMQHKLEQTVVEGSSGGGAVTATLNGKKQVLKIRIDPSAVAALSGPNPDVEMLEDLIVAAVNAAGQKAEDVMQSSLKGMLGGLNIPGLG